MRHFVSASKDIFTGKRRVQINYFQACTPISRLKCAHEFFIIRFLRTYNVLDLLSLLSAKNSLLFHLNQHAETPTLTVPDLGPKMSARKDNDEKLSVLIVAEVFGLEFTPLNCVSTSHGGAIMGLRGLGSA